ncbi:MAG: SDR family NAD(P)-dependent oxidoreductase, partial [Bacteroidota bacterium]
MNKITLITGATAGIGRATAFKLAENKHNLIITGRREERLKKLKEELEKAHEVSVHYLPFDIRNKEEVSEAIDSLSKDWQNIDVLVNNAGLAVGLNHLQDGE